jgi:hypothetical protein
MIPAAPSDRIAATTSQTAANAARRACPFMAGHRSIGS